MLNATNTETTKNAEIAPVGELIAHQDELTAGLDEYDVHLETGEPVGNAYGWSHESAAEWWAVENGWSEFIRVTRAGARTKSFRVSPNGDGTASVREIDV